MESARHAVWKSHSSNKLAVEVRRVDYHQIAAVPDRVIDVGQIPAGQFARLRMGRSEYSLTGATGLGSRTERMLLGSADEQNRLQKSAPFMLRRKTVLFPGQLLRRLSHVPVRFPGITYCRDLLATRRPVAAATEEAG